MNKHTFLLIPILVLTIVSLEVAELCWQQVDPSSPVGLWLFVLPDLAVFHLAPGGPLITLVDTMVYLAQSAAAVLVARITWTAARVGERGVHLISVQKVTVRASPQSEDWRGVCSRGERKCLSRFEFLLVS